MAVLRSLLSRLRPVFVAAATALVVSAPVTAVAQQAAGPDRLSETYADWSVTCTTAEGGTRACRMQQFQRQTENNAQVLALYVRATQQGPRISMVLPLGVRLRAGVTVAVGDEELAKVPYDICTNTGCAAGFAPTDEQMAKLRAGEALRVTVAATNGKAATIRASLIGFTAAWDRLNALRG